MAATRDTTIQRCHRVVGVAVLGALLSAGLLPSLTLAQQTNGTSDVSSNALKGRKVEGVKVVGNDKVSTAVILNVVRTHEGDAFDPATVQEDYQRIFGLRKFANVEPRIEPTATGVIVVFAITEQRQIDQIIIKGNRSVDDEKIRNAIDLVKGQAVDPFRIATAGKAIEELYKSKNYPLNTVKYDTDAAMKTGEITFEIVEGPGVRIKDINFIGNKSIAADKLRGQIKSKTYIWIFRDGTYDPGTVDDDVAIVRKFYQDKGFFDVRVGRKLLFSPDQTELQIDFLVEEGPRYTVDKVTFKGNSAVDEATLRANLNMIEGQGYEEEVVQRDIRKLVRDYSPKGFIYQPGAQDENYLTIEPRQVFSITPGKMELVYDIKEGKPFKIGQILPRGNTRTQDKVILREMRLSPGDIYDSGKVQDAVERLRGTPYFSGVKITPVGNDPEKRDLLVEVTEARTATLMFGAGVNSNGGIGGNITYTQRNFDITNWPNHFGDILSDKAFVGAGQSLRVSLEPGTQASNASIKFSEPWIFDQPYSFSSELFLRDRKRDVYDDHRIGGRLTFGHRFTDIYSASVALRAETVDINHIDDKPIRAFEILDLQGHSFLTSVQLSAKRDTTTGGLLPGKGSVIQAYWESFGALGGDYTFQKFGLSADQFYTLNEDLLDRKTVLRFSGDIGYITGSAPVFEKFYAGGISSTRGFAFRGISPRSGPKDDAVGGDFSITGTAELNFPLSGDELRGVVFTDVGMVESGFKYGTLRSSIGTGIRVQLPFLGQVPIAIDFAYPITKDSKDDTQLISFSLGFTP